MILNTHPWRVQMVGYAHRHGLPAPHDVELEKGFDVHSHALLGKPGRHFLARLQRNMVALLDANGKRVYPKVSETGILDLATRNVLRPPLSRGEKVTKYELSQSGVHESPWGSNRGRDVERYQSSTGAYGLPWCASFQSYCWRKYGYTGPISALAFAWLDFGPHVHPSDAKQGDPVVIHEGEGHIGCFLNLESNGLVRMVSGNTNNAVGVGDYSPRVATIVRLKGA